MLADCLYAKKQFVPCLMFAERGRAPSGKCPIQQTDTGNRIRLDPSPIGKLCTAGAANLVSQKLDDAFVNPIIVRLDNPLAILVNDLNEAPLFDCSSQQLSTFDSAGCT